jgi:hypothetical protein
MDDMTTSSLDEDRAVRATFNAFWSARAAGKPLAACYQAAVEMWRWLHPEEDPTEAAQHAVTLVLEMRRAAWRKGHRVLEDA